jgi:hypothetical protein
VQAGTVAPEDRIVVTALQAHEPRGADWTTRAGWDAHVSGPVDVAFSADGATAWVVHQSSDDVLVVPADVTAHRPAGADPLVEIPVGPGPTGLAVSPTSSLAFVRCATTRELSVVDLRDQEELGRISTVPGSTDRRPPELILGERVFTSSVPVEASPNQKVACASCHPDGALDGLVWNFQLVTPSLGPRATTSMLGLRQTYRHETAPLLGQLHRSGDRDELEDFEHTFRGVQMGGRGYFAFSPSPYLGLPNRGQSPEVDAMADWLVSLPAPARSPRRVGGRLTEAARRGATSFRAAGCAGCHRPDAGFVDRGFHDVGTARPEGEGEISQREPLWAVNTPTLLGLWTTAPYDDGGAARRQRQEVIEVLRDMQGRAASTPPHGNLQGPTLRQLRDLEALLLSLDGNTAGVEIQTARDIERPRLVRVEPTSPARLEAWFSEAVTEASAENIAHWRLVRSDGIEIPITEARWDPVHGDRVTLSAALAPGCGRGSYTVAPGPITDTAGLVAGGTPNALDVTDPTNVLAFTIGDTLTITLGSSGAEHVTIPVHDAGLGGSRAATTSQDSPWLAVAPDGQPVRGFVRFDWREALVAATGVTEAADIVAVSWSASPHWGMAQPVAARKVLKEWSDAHAGDEAIAAEGSVTWTHASYPETPWSAPGAGALGGDGLSSLDYGGAFDVAAVVDAVAEPGSMADRLAFAGDGVTEAYRFWFEHPELDHGHALELVGADGSELRLRRTEGSALQHDPALRITYAVAPPQEVAPELSGTASGVPLRVTRQGPDLRLSFELVPGGVYEVFEGAIGAWSARASAGCRDDASGDGPRASLLHGPAAGSRYVLVGLDGPCGGWLGARSDGMPRSVRPSGCGG